VISRKLVIAVAAGVLALGVAACGSDDNGGGGDSNLSGTIKMDGSSTVFPFAQAAAEKFQEENPDVKITVGEAGTTGGFEKFCAGETDISDASRPIEGPEKKACADKGIKYGDFQVANDGISIVTNPAIELSCLSTDQLKQLWDEGSTVKNLDELGKDPETGKPLPSAELSLFGPGTDSGTFDYFTETINGVEGQSRKDYQPSEDDNVLVEGVAGDQGGLGYFGFSYYEQNQDKLNLVSVADGSSGKCVAPSAETIQSGEYSPLSRPLFMYPSDDAAKRPEVDVFIKYVVDNYQDIADQAFIVPMDSGQADKAKSAVDGITG
jgi:phosphate transport system substrate-binding protein